MSDIMIIGEAYGDEEERLGQPFVGAAGHVLNSLLRQAGVNREECYLTNVFNLRPVSNDVEKLCTKSAAEALPGYAPFRLRPKLFIHAQYAGELARLKAEIERVQPNVILALGNTPLWALTQQSGVERNRGAPLLSSDGRWKIISTYHPSAILRQWNLRPIAFMDITKAKAESAFPELRRPKRLITYAPTLDEIADFYEKHIRPAPVIGTDIETKSDQITEIGFAPSPSRAIVIPFWSRTQPDGNFWRTHEEECRAWAWVIRILEEKNTIFQNGQYDMQYLYLKMGIPVPRFFGDTMLLHHALQPELKKGLGFLGSLYTSEPAWKFMRQSSDTLKQEDN